MRATGERAENELTARERRRWLSRQVWPSRAMLALGGMTVWASSVVYALALLVAPADFGVSAHSVDDWRWQVDGVVPGGATWRAGVRPHDALWWLGAAPSATPINIIGDAARSPLLAFVPGERHLIQVASGTADRGLALALFGMSSAFAIAGLISTLHGRRSQLVSVPVTLFATAAALSLTAVAPAGGALLVILQFASAAVAASGVVAMAFGLPTREIPRVPWVGMPVGIALSGGPLVLFALALAGRVDLYAPAWMAVFLLIALGAAGLIGKSLIALFRPGLGRDRRVARVLLTSLIAAVAPPALLSLGPARLFGDVLAPYSVTVLPGMILALGLTHAVTPTWRIGLQRALRQIYLHVVTWTALATAYTAIIVSMGRQVAGTAASPGDPWAVVALLVGVGVSVPFARAALLRRLETLIYRDAYDVPRVLRTVSVALASSTLTDDLHPQVIEPVRASVGLEWLAVARGVSPYEVVAMATDPLAIVPAPRQVQSAVAAVLGVGRSEVGAAVLPCELGDRVVAYVVAALREETLGLGRADRILFAGLASQLASFMLRVDLWAQLQRRVVELDDAAQRLSESQRLLRDLYGQVNAMLEDERRRISRDLHDEPLQKLVLLRRALGSLASGPYRSRDALLGLVDEAARDLRTICERLRPPVLDDLGLEAGLRWLAAETQRAAPLAIEVVVEGVPAAPRLPPDLETQLYRAAQEALTNVIRHAQAARVHIVLTRASDAARLTVRDNGVGFDVPVDLVRLASTGHLGLAGMHERLTGLGGVLRVHSRPGGPTTVEVELPVPLPAGAVGA